MVTNGNHIFGMYRILFLRIFFHNLKKLVTLGKVEIMEKYCHKMFGWNRDSVRTYFRETSLHFP